MNKNISCRTWNFKYQKTNFTENHSHIIMKLFFKIVCIIKRTNNFAGLKNAYSETGLLMSNTISEFYKVPIRNAKNFIINVSLEIPIHITRLPIKV